MLSINTSSGAQSGTKAGADKGPDKQPGTITAKSSEDHPAVLGQAGPAAAIAGNPPDKGSFHRRHASKKCALGSVHFAAEVVELAPHQDRSPAQSGSAIAQPEEHQQQQQQQLPNEPVFSQQHCKSNISGVGHQQPTNSSEAADHAQHDRPKGQLRVKEAGPDMKADGNATSSRSALGGNTDAKEIAVPMPRYIGSLIADLDPQLIINHWNKQKRGFTFRSKGAEVALEGSPRSTGAAAVGGARAAKSMVKP